MRNSKGQSLIEFAVATTLVIPILGLGIDSFLILAGMQFNESTCREAARSASVGDPRLALLRAAQVVSRASEEGSGTFTLSLVNAQTTVRKSQLQALTPCGGQVTGVINVTTAIRVKPLLLGWFLGKQKRAYLETTEEMPVTYVMPNALQKSGTDEDETTLAVSQYLNQLPESEDVSTAPAPKNTSVTLRIATRNEVEKHQ